MGAGKEMEGGGEVLGNNPRLNVCGPSAHTHFGKASGRAGAGGDGGRSALPAAGGFPGKKRSRADPAGVKFHRSLSCSDITEHSAHTRAHTHTPSTPQPSPHPAPSSHPRVHKPLNRSARRARGRADTARTVSLPTLSFLLLDVSETCR